MRTHVPLVRKSKLHRGGGLKPVSAKRAKLNKIYSALRKSFLAKHPFCQWSIKEEGLTEEEVLTWNKYWDIKRTLPKSEDIHHMKGRGKYLLDTSTWMAVSRKAHDYIHAHPKESSEKGYMLPR